MAPLAAQLAPHFAVFTYDRRGRGDSGDKGPYAVEREVEDIDALIKVAGGSALVCGVSSGAALALEAANRGLVVRKLALYKAPFIVDDTRAAVPEDIVPQLQRLIDADRRSDAVRALHEDRRCPGSFHRLDAIHASVVEAQGRGARFHATRRSFRTTSEADRYH